MCRKNTQNGFTMLEVMVAMGIFAISLVGVMGISTITVYYNRMSRQVDIASMFLNGLANEINRFALNPPNNFTNSIFNDTNSGNNSALGVIDLVNDPPGSPAPEHNETEIGLTSPVRDGIVYQRFWNVADIDQNGDGAIESKVIALIVRWRTGTETHYHYSVVTTALYRAPGY